jgi:alpha-beta hydrolase superfamily lysophospholipase
MSLASNLDSFSLKKEVIKIDYLKSSQGGNLFLKSYIPLDCSRVRYHFFICHGALEYHGRHHQLIHFLQTCFDQKAIISIFDLPGHGLSCGARSDVSDFSIFVNDFINFVNFSKSYGHEVKGIKNIIISHSMGGLISFLSCVSLQHHFKTQIDGIITSNPCIRPNTVVPRFSLGLIESCPEALQKIRLPLIHGASALTRDETKVREFELDPLINKSLSLGLGISVLNASKKLRSLGYYLNIPTLFLLSGNDLICDVEMSKLFISGIDQSLTDTVYYPKAKHELFNEINSEDVFNQIYDWINQRFV